MIFKKKYKTNFTTLDNTMLQDKRLSAKSKGILCYLMSKPETWIPRLEDISNNMTDGIDSIRSGIGELVEVGYMKRIFPKGENGRLEGSSWEVADYPCFKEESPTCHKTEYRETRISDIPIIGESNASKERLLVKTEYTSKERIPNGNFIIVSGLNSEPIYELHDYLNLQMEQAYEVYQMQNKKNYVKLCQNFLAVRCGESFNGNQHLWNAFKKFVPKYVETKEKSTVSLVDSQKDYFNK